MPQNLTEAELQAASKKVGEQIFNLIHNAGLPEDVQASLVVLMEDMSLEELMAIAHELEVRIKTGVAPDQEFLRALSVLKKEYGDRKGELQAAAMKELDEIEELLKE